MNHNLHKLILDNLNQIYFQEWKEKIANTNRWLKRNCDICTYIYVFMNRDPHRLQIIGEYKISSEEHCYEFDRTTDKNIGKPFLRSKWIRGKPKYTFTLPKYYFYSSGINSLYRYK